MATPLAQRLQNANINDQAGFDQFLASLPNTAEGNTERELIKKVLEDLHNFIPQKAQQRGHSITAEVGLTGTALLRNLHAIEIRTAAPLVFPGAAAPTTGPVQPPPHQNPPPTTDPLQIALDKIKALKDDSARIMNEVQSKRTALTTGVAGITDPTKQNIAQTSLDKVNTHLNTMTELNQSLLNAIEMAERPGGVIATNDAAAIEVFISTTLAQHKQNLDGEHTQFKNDAKTIDDIVEGIAKDLREAEAARRAAERSQQISEWGDGASTASRNFFNGGLLGQFNGAAGDSDVGNTMKHAGYVGAGFLRDAWNWSGDAWNFMNNEESLGGWAPLIVQGAGGLVGAAVLKRAVIDPIINSTFGKIPIIGGLFRGIVSPILSLVGGLIGGSALVGALQRSMNDSDTIVQGSASHFAPVDRNQIGSARTISHDGRQVQVSAVAPDPEAAKQLNQVIDGTEQAAASASALVGTNPKFAAVAANYDLSVAATQGNPSFTLASLRPAGNDNPTIVIEAIPHHGAEGVALESKGVTLNKGADNFYVPVADNSNYELNSQAPMVG